MLLPDDTEPVVSELVLWRVDAGTLVSLDSRRMLVLELFRSTFTPLRTVVRLRTDSEGSFSS